MSRKNLSDCTVDEPDMTAHREVFDWRDRKYDWRRGFEHPPEDYKIEFILRAEPAKTEAQPKVGLNYPK